MTKVIYLLLLLSISIACGGGGGGGQAAYPRVQEGENASELGPIFFESNFDYYQAMLERSKAAAAPFDGVIESPFLEENQRLHDYEYSSYHNKEFNYDLIADIVNEAWYSMFEASSLYGYALQGQLFYPSGQEYLRIEEGRELSNTAGFALTNYPMATIDSNMPLEYLLAVTFHELSHLNMDHHIEGIVSPEYSAVMFEMLLSLELALLDENGWPQMTRVLRWLVNRFVSEDYDQENVYHLGVGLALYALRTYDGSMTRSYYKLIDLEWAEQRKQTLSYFTKEQRELCFQEAFKNYAKSRSYDQNQYPIADIETKILRMREDIQNSASYAGWSSEE